MHAAYRPEHSISDERILWICNVHSICFLDAREANSPFWAQTISPASDKRWVVHKNTFSNVVSLTKNGNNVIWFDNNVTLQHFAIAKVQLS